MRGSQILWQAESYFGLSTNQQFSTLTPCIAKACWVSIGPPAAPGVLPLIHWVIWVQLRGREMNPSGISGNCPLHSAAPDGTSSCCCILRPHILISLFLSFHCFWEVLSVFLFFIYLFFSDVRAAAVATERKRFSASKDGEGEISSHSTFWHRHH